MRFARGSAVAGVLLVLSACVSTDDPAPSGGPADSDRSTALRDFLGYEEQTHGDDEWIARERDRQNQIASCMEDRGFVYVPVDPQSQIDPSIALMAREGGTRAFAEKYGYGITLLTSPDSIGGSSQPEDPNLFAVDSMTPSERSAYLAALQGVDDSLPDGVPGCLAEVSAVVDRDQLLPDEQNPASSGLFEEYARLSAEAQADPRLIAAGEEWADCMAEKGFTGLDVRRAEESLHLRWHELLGFRIVDGGGMIEPDADSAPALDQKEVEQFKTDEIVQAVADFDCRAPWNEIRAEVHRKTDEKFLSENLEALEAYREWVNSGD